MRPWSTARRRVSGSAHAFVEVTSRRLEVEPVPTVRLRLRDCIPNVGRDALGTAGHLSPSCIRYVTWATIASASLVGGEHVIPSVECDRANDRLRKAARPQLLRAH